MKLSSFSSPCVGGYKERFVKEEPNRYPEVRHYRNIIMIKINSTPQSPSRSLIT